MRDHKKENEILINLLKDGTQYSNIISVFDYFNYLANTNKEEFLIEKEVSKPSPNNISKKQIPNLPIYSPSNEGTTIFDKNIFFNNNICETQFYFGSQLLSLNISNALGIKNVSDNTKHGLIKIISNLVQNKNHKLTYSIKKISDYKYRCYPNIISGLQYFDQTSAILYLPYDPKLENCYFNTEICVTENKIDYIDVIFHNETLDSYIDVIKLTYKSSIPNAILVQGGSTKIKDRHSVLYNILTYIGTNRKDYEVYRNNNYLLIINRNYKNHFNNFILNKDIKYLGKIKGHSGYSIYFSQYDKKSESNIPNKYYEVEVFNEYKSLKINLNKSISNIAGGF